MIGFHELVLPLKASVPQTQQTLNEGTRSEVSGPENPVDSPEPPVALQDSLPSLCQSAISALQSLWRLSEMRFCPDIQQQPVPSELSVCLLHRGCCS